MNSTNSSPLYKYFNEEPMKKEVDLSRLSIDDTNHLIETIPVLKNMFHQNNPRKIDRHELSENVNLFLFSSRVLAKYYDDDDIPSFDYNESTLISSNLDEDSEYSSNVVHSPTSFQNALLHREKKRKFAIAISRLAAQENKRSKIVDDGVIPTLQTLSQIQDRVIKVCCSISLLLLTKDPFIRRKMVEQGVVLSVINLSATRNFTVRKNCSIILCNLFTIPGYEANHLRDGALSALIKISSSCKNDIHIMETCLKALLNLTCVTERYPRLDELHEALFHFDDNYSQYNDTIRQLVVSITCNLSAIEGNQLKLIEDGCMKVIAWACKSANSSIRKSGCDIIRNLTSEYRSRTKLVEKNVLLILLVMSQDNLVEVRISAITAFNFLCKETSLRQVVVSKQSLQLLQLLSFEKLNEINILAAKTWRILCRDNDIGVMMIKFGVMSSLLILSQSLSRHVYDNCSLRKSSQSNLKASTEMESILSPNRKHDRVKRHGSMLTLQQRSLMELRDLKSVEIEVAYYVMESICHLLKIEDDALIIKMLEENVTSIIIQITQRYEDVKTSQWCAFAIFLLVNKSCFISSSKYFITLDQGLISCLIKLCCNVDKLTCNKTKLISSAAFISISSITSLTCKEQIITLLVYLLKDHEVPKDAAEEELLLHIRMNCSTSLYHMLYDDINCSIMMNLNVLHPIIDLVNSSIDLSHEDLFDNIKQSSSILVDKQVLIKCSAILTRLSYYYNVSSEEDIQSVLDILNVLLKLSVVDDVHTQRRAVFALSHLIKDSSVLRNHLISLKPIRFIVPLASKRDIFLWKACCSLICNLSYERGYELQMVEDGIVSTIIVTTLVNTDHIDSNILGCKALLNLVATSNPTIYSSRSSNNIVNDENDKILHCMIQENIIWGISSMALMDSLELLFLCSRLLCRLSLKFSINIIECPTAIRAIKRMLSYNDIDLLRHASIMIMNMSLTLTNNSKSLTKTTSTKRDEYILNFGMSVISSMKHLAFCEDQIVKENCIYCLHLLSSYPKLQEHCLVQIVSSGIFHLLFANAPEISLLYGSNDNKALKDIFLSLLSLYINVSKASSDSSIIYNDNINRYFCKILQIFVLDVPIKQKDLYNVKFDEEIINALLKSFYCISCSMSQVNSVFHQIEFMRLMITLVNSLLIKTMTSNSKDMKIIKILAELTIQEREHVELIIAILYNISSPIQSQHILVHHGIIQVFEIIFQHLYESIKISSLNSNEQSICYLSKTSKIQVYHEFITQICKAITFLGCGKINSEKYIEDGSMTILFFITDYYNLQYQSISTRLSNNTMDYFPIELYYWCAIAINNALVHFGNHKMLLESRVLDAIKNLHAFNHLVEDRILMPTEVSLRHEIRKSCASSLRSLSFNKEERLAIVSSGAMQVILADLQEEFKDDSTITSISNNLLQEIETESWAINSSKIAKTREEKITPILNSLDIHDNMLRQESKMLSIELVIDYKFLDIPKYHGISDISEVIMQDTSATGTNKHIVGDIYEVTIDELDFYDDIESDNALKLYAQEFHRLDVNIDSEKLFGEMDDTRKGNGILTGMASPDISRAPSIIIDSKTLPLIGGGDVNGTDFIVDINTSTYLQTAEASHKLAMVRHIDEVSLPHITQRGNYNDVLSLGSTRYLERTPKRNPAINNNSKISRPKQKVVTKEEKFNNIVSLIKQSKSMNNPDVNIDLILREWRSYSGR